MELILVLVLVLFTVLSDYLGWIEQEEWRKRK